MKVLNYFQATCYVYTKNNTHPQEPSTITTSLQTVFIYIAVLATVLLPARACVILVNASFKMQAVALVTVGVNRVASKNVVNPRT